MGKIKKFIIVKLNGSKDNTVKEPKIKGIKYKLKNDYLNIFQSFIKSKYFFSILFIFLKSLFFL